MNTGRIENTCWGKSGLSCRQFNGRGPHASPVRRKTTRRTAAPIINEVSQQKHLHYVGIPSAPASPPVISRPVDPNFPWIQIFVTTCLTISALASFLTAFIVYMRPALRAAQRAAERSEDAAKDMQVAAKEMEKTALMFQQDIPLTMQDMQRTAEEWELVGKQVNFIVTSVTRPLKPVEKPVEKAAEWVGEVAESTASTTASLSKKMVSDTSALATSLWTTVNQFRRQLGWNGLRPEDAEEAKRVVNIGRQQQEARSWIAAWRSRTGGITFGMNRQSAGLSGENGINRRRSEKMRDLQQNAEKMGQMLEERVGPDGIVPQEARDAVAAVFAALERAQRAAEEAAASSTALELALEKAESAGALSSSDEDDQIFVSNEDIEPELRKL